MIGPGPPSLTGNAAERVKSFSKQSARPTAVLSGGRIVSVLKDSGGSYVPSGRVIFNFSKQLRTRITAERFTDMEKASSGT